MNRKMKHGLFKTLMLVGLISFVGCSEKEVELPVGDPRTPDLILNKDSIIMDAAGGVDTLIVENYNEWAVTGGYTIIDGDTTDYHLEPAMQMPYDYKHYVMFVLHNQKLVTIRQRGK